MKNRKTVEELRGLEEDYLHHAYSIIRQYPVQSKEQLLQQQKKAQEEEQQRKRRRTEEDGDDEGEKNKKDGKKEKKDDKKNNAKGENDNDSSTTEDKKYLFDTKFGIPVNVKKKSTKSTKRAGAEEEVENTTILVTPTTEELNYQIQNHQHLLEISKFRTEAKQLSEEKVAVANQVCSLLDVHIQRLDADLEKFEKYVAVVFMYLHAMTFDLQRALINILSPLMMLFLLVY